MIRINSTNELANFIFTYENYKREQKENLFKGIFVSPFKYFTKVKILGRDDDYRYGSITLDDSDMQYIYEKYYKIYQEQLKADKKIEVEEIKLQISLAEKRLQEAESFLKK